MVGRSWRKKLAPKLREQVDRALDMGCTLSQPKSTHVRVSTADGRQVMTLALTASDWRTHLNEASRLRKRLDEIETP